MPKLYEELASWWPLLSPPADYEEEAAFYGQHAGGRVRTPAADGARAWAAAAGNNASHLKARFEMVLVDPSPGMLAVSRELNPECEHVQGDMRTAQARPYVRRASSSTTPCVT